MWRGDRPNWSQTHELLARLLELTDHGIRQNATAHGVKKEKLGKPLRIEHPDRPKPKVKKNLFMKEPGRLARMFGRSKGGE